MIMQERPYLSIGEVLGLLLEEFPDVTISKIRFLESQGLIDPERTASGYRKFYDNDVDLLRVILREQRENFLPLRVIRDRLESGAIEDPTGPTTPPKGIRSVGTIDDPDDDQRVDPVPAATAIATTTGPRHDGGNRSSSRCGGRATSDGFRSPPRQLCRRAICAAWLGSPNRNWPSSSRTVCSAGKGTGDATLYTVGDLAIAQAAAGFMQHGIGGRHLKAWRQAAEREASLFEQMILPLLRQRNPQARQQAVDTLTSLAALGGELRSAIVHSALSHHLDG